MQTSRSQTLEFLHGLVNSGQPFFWVVRKDVFWDHEETKGVIVEEIKMWITEGRRRIVDWAPQEQVLAHKAVGGFLTRGGWNSLRESIVGWLELPRYVGLNLETNLLMTNVLWNCGELELELNLMQEIGQL